MNVLQICPPNLTLRSPKNHFFNIIIHILQKKTNSNCCTVALAVYLLLFSASCTALVLRLGHATGGARVLIWTC